MLVVPRVGAVRTTEDLWEPVRLIDAASDAVPSVAAFLKELQASGRSTSTQRSYAMDLLRWFRFRLGRRGAVGPGDPAGGPRLLSLARVEREASSANRWCPISQQPPEPGDWQARPGPEVCRGDACALRDRAAGLL